MLILYASLCRSAAEEVPGRAADDHGGNSDGAADAGAARAGAPAAAGRGGQLVAARAPGLGNLPGGQRAVHEHWRPGERQRHQ